MTDPHGEVVQFPPQPFRRWLDPAVRVLVMDDRPDLIDALRGEEPTWREELAADWRELIGLVSAYPESYALVALAGFMFGLLIVIVPALVLS